MTTYEMISEKLAEIWGPLVEEHGDVEALLATGDLHAEIPVTDIGPLLVRLSSLSLQLASKVDELETHTDGLHRDIHDLKRLSG